LPYVRIKDILIYYEGYGLNRQSIPLVVQGIRDKTNLPEMSEVLARNINISKLVVFPGGHVVQKKKRKKALTSIIKYHRYLTS